MLDLFAGIGGFSLAARRVGWETVAFCEIDPYCQKVLAKHWPGVPIYSDVRELTADAVGPVDIITGGYPCQPFSLAGKRGGAGDDRHLWPEFARLVRELRPSYVVAENVAGHITMGLDEVLADLEGLGYTCGAVVIPACAVDAPHRRDRVWIVAGNTDRSHEYPQRGIQEKNGDTKRVCRNVANTGSKGLSGLCGTSGVQQEHADDGKHCRWPPESGVDRMAHGVPRRLDRLRGLGNAIVPRVAEMIFRAIDA